MKKKVRKLTDPWESSYEQYSFSGDEPPTGENFWADAGTLVKLLANANWISCWDFKSSQTTRTQKQEDFCNFITDIKQYILHTSFLNSPTDNFWLAGDNATVAMIATMSDFVPTPTPTLNWNTEKIRTANFPMLYANRAIKDAHKLMNEDVQDIGIYNETWRVFLCHKFPPKKILAGIDNYKHDKLGYARINLENLLV